MKFVDYYKVMGVPENADPAQIKKAYRRLARKFHPDVSKEPEAEARFKELGEAYEVLKDPEKRAEYDQLRQYGVGGQEFRPPPGWQPRGHAATAGFREVDPREFSDFFEAIFGGAGRGRAGSGPGFAMRGEDIHYRLPVSLEDSYSGATRGITLNTHRIDPKGNAVPDSRTLNVRIPRGVIHGQHIRLRGQGGAGIGGGPAGDLYLEVELVPHPVYSVSGRDVTLVLPVAPWEAALGATVRAPTPAGPVSLTIHPNSRAGQKLRIKGRGLPGAPAGDFYAVLQIVLPELRTEAERQRMRELQQAFSFNPRQRLGV